MLIESPHERNDDFRFLLRDRLKKPELQIAPFLMPLRVLAIEFLSFFRQTEKNLLPVVRQLIAVHHTLFRQLF